MDLAKKATIIALICAFFLAFVKFIAGILSGSVAVLASAIDSMIDFAISAFNFLALKKSSSKPNTRYNFGFSKIEALAGFVEGCFIFAVGIFIFYQSVLKIYHNESVDDLNLGVGVMIFALILTFLLVLYLSHVAKKTKSLVVESDCLHYKSDLLSNALTLLALALIHFTHWHIIDAIFGIAVSFYTAYSAFGIVKKSLSFLMDRALDDEQIGRIKELIESHKEVISFHHLKTRKTPSTNYVSLHLVFCPIISLLNAHRISDEIEEGIRALCKDEKWELQIHLDPYDDQEEERKRL